MKAGEYKFEIERGATFRRWVSWEDDSGVKQSLDDYEPNLLIFEFRHGPLLLAHIPVVVDDVAQWFLTPDETENLSPTDKAWYEFYFNNTTDELEAVRFLQGKVAIT